MICFSEQDSSNCYVIIRFDEVILIDPSSNFFNISKLLEGKHLSSILLTHAHFDHILDISKYGDVPICLNKLDEELLFDDSKNGSVLYRQKLNLKDKHLNIKYLTDNQTIKLLDKEIKVIFTPGHTKGSVSFVYEDNLFTGDTLFKGDVGRTDLYGGSSFLLNKSLLNIFTTFRYTTKIFPGHGEQSTIGLEKKENYYYLKHIKDSTLRK